MSLRSGTIEIRGEVISPGYIFEDFQNSVFYEGQDGVMVIQINDAMQIEGNHYLISFFFRNKVLHLLSLVCIDIDIPFSEELKRKQFHDEILKTKGLDPESAFAWGKIESAYDPKGNVSSINIIYTTSPFFMEEIPNRIRYL